MTLSTKLLLFQWNTHDPAKYYIITSSFSTWGATKEMIKVQHQPRRSPMHHNATAESFCHTSSPLPFWRMAYSCDGAPGVFLRHVELCPRSGPDQPQLHFYTERIVTGPVSLQGTKIFPSTRNFLLKWEQWIQCGPQSPTVVCTQVRMMLNDVFSWISTIISHVYLILFLHSLANKWYHLN